MAKHLVVVESPAKAKTINKFLGPNYVVKASYGHVRDLPKRELGVDLENDFQPKYVSLRDSSKAIKALKEAAAKADEILLASDPDREGEAIGWHVAELLKGTKKPVSRIVFNEITKRSVQEAAGAPRELDMNLVNAQQARRVLDRLVGYKVSPILQWAVQRGLSAGRVQSVAVRMVCEREDEIRAFVPREYWTLDADLLTPRHESFTARLSKIRGEKAEVADEAQAQAIVADVQGAPFTVSSVERKEVRRRPAPPFITSTLQQEASRRFGFGPRRTMVIAQQLYEGIAIGDEGTTGLITYMRTDSTRIAAEAIDEVRSYIGSQFEAAMLPGEPNVYKSKKGAQDAHEAIRPTLASHTPEAMKQYLDADQLKLYTLIWKRFVASQMSPAILDQTTVDVTVGDYVFRAVGSVMKFPGFTTLYTEAKESSGSGNGAEEGKEDRKKDGKEKSPSAADDSKLLPPINEGESLELQELRPEQHFTKPPPRFSEATLIRALEENGIGRPSTYAATVNRIIEVKYVAREKRRLRPTELGEEVNTLLVKHFPDILDIAFTARLEDDLDHVEEGQREWHDLLKAFYTEFEKDLDQTRRRLVAEFVEGETKCPKCESEVEVRDGRFGPFLGCVKYPECDGRIAVKKKDSAIPTDEICDACGSPMVIRRGRFGRFMACSTYPKCKNTHDVDEDGKKVDRPPREAPKKTDQPCPDCGAFLLIRKNRRGEEFYGCEKYPKCKFTKPMELGLKCLNPGCEGDLVTRLVKRSRMIGCDKYPECDFRTFGQLDKETPCPKCGNSWTTVMKPRGKPRVRKCPAPGCGHEEELPEVEEDV
jgi:DNA topoisomerase I